MTIKINITQTESGYGFFNADSKKVIATIREGRNKPGIYLWETLGDYGWGDLKGAFYTLKEVLSQRAANLGCDIEFINL